MRVFGYNISEKREISLFVAKLIRKGKIFVRLALRATYSSLILVKYNAKNRIEIKSSQDDRFQILMTYAFLGASPHSHQWLRTQTLGNP
jgi:hypothetical protein